MGANLIHLQKNNLNKNDTHLPDEFRKLFKKHSTSLLVPKGKIIITQEDKEYDVYLVQSGLVEISFWSLDAKETIFREIHEGEFFGELAAIDNKARSANVVAVANSKLYKMSGKTFRDLLDTHQNFRSWFIKTLVARIRSLSNKTVDLSHLNVGPRLWKELIRMIENLPIEDDSVIIEKFPSQEKLAARLGAGREAINRELGSLIQSNYIKKMGRRKIKILSVSSIRRLIENLYD